MIETPGTLPALLDAVASAQGDRPAVVDGEAALTFGELREQVRCTARAYAALGVAPGDRVSIWAPNCWQWEVAALAVTYAGATLVPLNTRYTGHEVVDVLRRTSTSLLVVADGFLGRSQLTELEAAAAEEASELGSEADLVTGLPDLRALVRISGGRAASASERRRDHLSGDHIEWDDLATVAADTPEDEIDRRAAAVKPDDIADILFTSGTTGRSKGVLTAHRQTIAAADVWARTVGVTAEDRYLVINPFFHSFGYKAGIVVSLVSGCALYPQATFDLTGAMELIDSAGITVLPGAPTVFLSLLNTDRSAYHLGSLRLAVTGAAFVPVTLIEQMHSVLGIETALTAFGMTECVVATMCRPGDPPELVAATSGRAVDGLEIWIADGEILFRGPMVMRGYLDDPEATAAAIDADGWLHTGDVGHLDDNGYLTVTDRIKDMYICGGFNVYPAEVEQALARLDGVVESAVVGVPDERLGEVGRAFVVRRDGATLTEDDVIAHAKERIANFKVPRSVVFVDALPRNLSGKILKTELRSGS
ncbi:FadD3 family acyl-CoA ligase [Nocardioides speluncae]|uniref:FadD3 family acyl-CoA ligase n=1 Tax=Nocardioides speluncae TaxID=2670337 RepID=UPI00197E6305|nr:FadD3 family acyl-CoA ligase [Nocardioides speluncae]